jgi:biotin carboxyl carrier protein
VEETDYANKSFVLRIDGFRHRVRLSDPYDVLVDRLGLAKSTVALANDVKAPMPGLVREILVAEGEHVQAGDAILILEAMKMENVIKAAGEGMVESISVLAGQSVDKGQVLITFTTI